VLNTILFLSHFNLLSLIFKFFKPSASSNTVIYVLMFKQIRANIQVVHFAKSKILEPNTCSGNVLVSLVNGQNAI